MEARTRAASVFVMTLITLAHRPGNVDPGAPGRNAEMGEELTSKGVTAGEKKEQRGQLDKAKLMGWAR